MNRRTQGRVKQARRRAQKRADIRAGRILSMQQMLNNTAHNHHEHEEEPAPEILPEGTHELVNNETGQVLQRGTERQMRKQRTISLEASPEGSFSVKKVKLELAS